MMPEYPLGLSNLLNGRRLKMARSAYKLPSVFIGCPYGEKAFKFSAFKKALDKIPFKWYYADTRLKTKQLLGILKSYVRATDFCIFDASTWNPNVALEIGLAEGNNVDYYIMVNHSLSKNVPSDIQGLQRITYYNPSGFDSKDMIPQITRYLVKEFTHPKNIFNELSNENKDKKFYFALAILAHFRDNKYLTSNDIRLIGKGTYLRSEAHNEVLELLEQLELISGMRRRGRQLKKNLFPEDLNIG